MGAIGQEERRGRLCRHRLHRRAQRSARHRQRAGESRLGGDGHAQPGRARHRQQRHRADRFAVSGPSHPRTTAPPARIAPACRRGAPVAHNASAASSWLGTWTMRSDWANEFATEHLEVQCGDRSRQIAERITNAGAVFIGPYTPVAVGDYWAGPSHTLPTGSRARFSSALTSNDFVKSISLIEYTAEQLAAAADDIIRLAADGGSRRPRPQRANPPAEADYHTSQFSLSCSASRIVPGDGPGSGPCNCRSGYPGAPASREPVPFQQHDRSHTRTNCQAPGTASK